MATLFLCPMSAFSAAWQEAESARLEVIERVRPAVVSVFGVDRAAGGGSGVLISSDGLALTNFHVVAAAEYAGVAALPNGKLYPWKLISVDPGGDLALIRLLGADPFPTVEPGFTADLSPGDPVLTMGNPFNLSEDGSPSVSLGILSGKERFQPGESGSYFLVYGQCLQIDASINPGNSGGPLFDLSGRLIGINGRGSFFERGRVNVGLGYAISIEQIRKFLPHLRRGGLVHHAGLGATFSDAPVGLICNALDTESELARAGLSLGDQLLAVDDVSPRSANHLASLLTIYPAESRVKITWQSLAARQPPGAEAMPPAARSAVIRLETLDYEADVLKKMKLPELAPVDPAAEPVTTLSPAWNADASPPASPARPATSLAALLPALQARMVKLQGPSAGMETGHATGILISSTGRILAAHGVYLLGEPLQVTLANGKRHSAHVLHRDVEAGLALLQIEADTPDFFALSVAAQPRRGDEIFVIANPFNVAQGEEPLSITHGILAWRGPMDAKKRMHSVSLPGDVLLLDAITSNPGAPGGAVITPRGELVGMVGKVLENSNTGARLNYAIPVTTLLDFLRRADLPPGSIPGPAPAASSPPSNNASPKPTPGKLGFRLFTLGGLDAPAYIDQVLPLSPAARAGIQKDDLLLSLDNQKIRDVRHAQQLLGQLTPGQSISLILKRGQNIVTLTLTLTAD